ncbi:CHAT domain-containing protein [Petropleomorpha daqingensis]|uniref:Tetratricopeptide (TPR) repeat protein n=1 Tax=Petropleomorpha daqingensis TaxID=2026353 RepID=A0A853CP33_9ACTN|nr:tetratricopeptide (TPR) repeat protein [Petropleomorpha daqingensis]
MDGTTLELAQEALRLAEADPVEAVTRARSAVRRAERSADGVARAVAERAWGLALRHGGHLDKALVHLRRAVDVALEAGAPEVAGEARMSLAYALVERGRAGQALDEIGRALRQLDGVAHARAQTQRGSILLDMGRHAEALEEYEAALPVLQEAGDLLWSYRVVWNRGLARAYRHEFLGAEEDLRRAEELADRLDLPLSVGFAQANLAFVLGLRGDVPAALDHSARAEERIRAHGAQLGELLKDRSELLLSVRLVSEARETAEASVAEYERERRSIKLPQVRLVLAQSALLEGDADGALRHARRAVAEFSRQRRPEFTALARLGVLQAQHAAGAVPPAGARAAEEAAATLAAVRWPAAAMEARLLAAALLRDRGRPDDADRHLGAAAATRRTGPATLRARGWYAEARLRAEAGRRQAACTALRTGLRILDEHRAVLGATDVRAHAAAHRSELVELGLRLALDGGSPRQVLEWVERGKATDLLVQRPVRPPEDPEVAQALAELRATVLQINELQAGGERGPALDELMARQPLLERRVRDATRRIGGAGTGRLPAPVPVGALAERLDGAALVELFVLDGVLCAVTVVGARSRVHRLAATADVEGLLDRVLHALRRLVRRNVDAAGRAAAEDLLRAAAARLDERLLGTLPELGDRPLVVVPTGALQCLPWAVLPSCAARPVAVAPSASLWHAARSRPVETGGRVVVAAGPSLEGAVSEVRGVGDVHGVEPMLPPEATVARVLKEMEGAALVHLAAHGRLVADNPLFSDVLLADGPLLAYDVERLDRAPHTVVLAACDTARSVVCAGDELLGLGAVFLGGGTAQLVAPMLPVPDVETAEIMGTFHRMLAAGSGAADALVRTRAQVGEDVGAAAAASFVVLGAGV